MDRVRNMLYLGDGAVVLEDDDGVFLSIDYGTTWKLIVLTNVESNSVWKGVETTDKDIGKIRRMLLRKLGKEEMMECGLANIQERLAIRDSIEEKFGRVMMDFAALAMLQAYQGSPEFGEDASEYCRNQGWQEP